MSSYCNLEEGFTVESDKVKYTDDTIISEYTYESTLVEGNVVKPVQTKMQFKTDRKVGKIGVMLVGLGGNNGW
jgi:myo-inositol-1-phosphate synthase